MNNKREWIKLEESYIPDLVNFSKNNYPHWEELDKDYVNRFFKKYNKTTFIFFYEEEIRGFAVYQEWPDAINFILICLPFDRLRNLTIMEKGLKQAKEEGTLPDKPIVWWDEDKMEAKGMEI